MKKGLFKCTPTCHHHSDYVPSDVPAILNQAIHKVNKNYSKKRIGKRRYGIHRIDINDAQRYERNKPGRGRGGGEGERRRTRKK